MDLLTFQLRSEIASLRIQLAAAFKEKATAEQSLLLGHGEDPIPVAEERHDAPTKDAVDIAPEGESADRHLEHGILDAPPRLDLPIRGLRTAHDGESELLGPLLSLAPSTQPTTDAIHYASFASNRQSPTESFSTPSFRSNESGQVSGLDGAVPPPRRIATRQLQLHGTANQLSWYRDRALPTYFIHGLQYKVLCAPQWAFRCVVLTGLPSKVNVSGLLSKIRGATVVSCRLMDTTRITNKSSALLRFKDESEVQDFVRHTAKHPLVFFGHTARTALIQKPSYPLSEILHYKIFFEDYTRCLKIARYAEINSRKVPEACLRSKIWASVAVAQTILGPDGALSIDFTSIQQASNAYDYLLECGVPIADLSFAPDPCAQPFRKHSGSFEEVLAEQGFDAGMSSEDSKKTPEGSEDSAAE
ncbi:MAG: hypothetical protein LQ340_000529 [Diploschistes diacapsis]|nr:MAG: hypothetical protein LQ340_000529 [Diploschistes diacapsis]